MSLIDLRTGKTLEEAPDRVVKDVDEEQLGKVAFEAFAGEMKLELLWVELEHDGRRPWLAVGRAMKESLSAAVKLT